MKQPLLLAAITDANTSILSLTALSFDGLLVTVAFLNFGQVV